MTTQYGKQVGAAGCSLFGAILFATCLLSGAIRADDSRPVEQVDLMAWTRQIDLNKCSYDELDFYEALKMDGSILLDSRVHTTTRECDAEMLLAIQQGDVDSLRDVLAHGVDPTQFDPDRLHHSPVYWAVYFDRPDMVNLLLDHRAEGWMGPANVSALELAQRIHPEMIPILRNGIKRNREILGAQLTGNLHASRVDVPAFSHASFQDVTNFMMGAMNRANVGYLERGAGIAMLTVGPARSPAPVTTPAMHNVSLWDALQTIAGADHLKIVITEGDVTFYPVTFKVPAYDP